MSRFRFSKLSEKLIGLTQAVTRYPGATAFLLLATAVNAYALTLNRSYGRAWRAGIIGALLAAVLQAVYERFFEKPSARAGLSALGAAAAGLFYLLIRSAPEYSFQTELRTGVLLFALMFAFMLAPAVKSSISFNESFMAAFKALFQALLYAAVFFIGCSLIVAAFDTLIAPIDSVVYRHIANVVFQLLAPVFFLSLIPVYPGRRLPGGDPAAASREEALARATDCPRFLEILISYIIIPLAEIFTVILVLYIVLNIGGDFWRNNLLEPLLISYAITIISILFLAARLPNRMAAWFCKIFPKVLVPVVVFQLLASALILRDTGVTHSRYFVLLFGVFAACAGVLLSLAPVRKSGIAAALLIVFSLVSITPPVDAFTVSRQSQRQRLEAVLIKNDMLQNGRLVPAANLPEQDRDIITSSMDYLYRIDAAGRLTWLPADFDYYADFESAFGFSRYGDPGKNDRYINLFLPSDTSLDIDGYAVLVRTSVNADPTGDETISALERAGRQYTLAKADGDRFAVLRLTDSDGQELIRFDTGELFSRYSGYTGGRSALTAEQATFTAENDRARLAVVVQSTSLQLSTDYYYADLYVMAAIK